MNMSIAEIMLAALLLLDICLVSSSRLLHCIRMCAVQGLIIGILPCVIAMNGHLSAEIIAIAVVSVVVKACFMPWMLARTMRRCGIKRELEPIVNYCFSLVLTLLACVAAFYFCNKSSLVDSTGSKLALPVVFITMFAGLFLIMARRKAIVQVIGFLCFENGIGLFGMMMHLENGLLTEMGILLDVLTLTFIMGIAIFNIRREYSHIDADKMNLLDDNFHPHAE